MKKENVNVTIFPPCGENVGLPTKRGANKANFFWPLLPRLTVVLPTQGREITTRGFTLIELLVVVLIIGILAAVALPQYQVATKKAKLLALAPLMDAIYKAEQTYFLSHGEYTYNIDSLDIEIPAQGCTPYGAQSSGLICGNIRVAVHGSSAPTHAGIALLDNNGGNDLQMARYFDTELEISKNTITCFATNETANKVCKSLGIKSDIGGKGVWTYRYILDK